MGNIGGTNPSPAIGGNWSGYVAETNFSSPQLNSVTYVSASWVVPSVSRSSSASAYSEWVGIGGKSTSPGIEKGDERGLEQLGTEVDWNYDGISGPDYYAWWEMFPAGETRIYSMTIAPGDVISASVQYYTSGLFAGYYYLSITDDSRANDSFATLQSAPASGSYAAQRNSAEWIVEDISGPPNFSPVSFADATATINGVSGPISSPYWQSQAQFLNTSALVPLTTASMLTNFGDAFVETENAAPSVIGPNVMTDVPPSSVFNGPDLTGPATRDKPRPRAAAANVQNTTASSSKPAERPAIAIYRRSVAQAENVQDTAVGLSRAFRPMRMGSYLVH